MEKRMITEQEAIHLLNDSEDIHTFRNGSAMLIGADWSRKSILKAIKDNSGTLQIAGNMARSMKHGLILEDATGYLFIETNKEKLDEFDPIQEETNN